MVQLLKAGASTVLFDPVLQLDTMGIFHNEYPGADSPVTGLVTLLATAKALWSQRKFILNQPNSTDIMFAFFQGVSCALPGFVLFCFFGGGGVGFFCLVGCICGFFFFCTEDTLSMIILCKK